MVTEEEEAGAASEVAVEAGPLQELAVKLVEHLALKVKTTLHQATEPLSEQCDEAPFPHIFDFCQAN